MGEISTFESESDELEDAAAEEELEDSISRTGGSSGAMDLVRMPPLSPLKQIPQVTSMASSGWSSGIGLCLQRAPFRVNRIGPC